MYCIVPRDTSVFNFIMALRKLGWFELDFLASCKDKPEMVEKIQRLFLYVGVNYWTEGPAKIIGAAWRIKNEYCGKIPEDPLELMSFNGIGKKICSLVLQDAVQKAICPVTDTHVIVCAYSLGLSDKTNPNELAQELASWLDPKYWKMLNEYCGGLRQQWRSAKRTGYKDKIMALAKEMGMEDLIVVGICEAGKHELEATDGATRPGAPTEGRVTRQGTRKAAAQADVPTEGRPTRQATKKKAAPKKAKKTVAKKVQKCRK
ncbi:MAG: hypothetical protein SGILL_004662 [Bacillariaceae sp.]